MRTEMGQLRARVYLLSPLACLVIATLTGCGGGGEGASATSFRSDGQIALSAQTIRLVTDAGESTSLTLSTPAVLAPPGKEVLLPVSVSDRSRIAGVAVRLQYDPAVLECSDIELGDWLPASAHTVKSTGTSAGVAVAGTTGAPAGAGVLATFHLCVSPTATPQNASLKVNAVLTDERGQTLGRSGLPSGQAVRAQATSNLIGDLTGSGNPEVGSAINILRVVVGLDPQPSAADLWQWDCDGSGAVDVGDAIKLLRCVVALDTWPIGTGGTATLHVTVLWSRYDDYAVGPTLYWYDDDGCRTDGWPCDYDSLTYGYCEFTVDDFPCGPRRFELWGEGDNWGVVWSGTVEVTAPETSLSIDLRSPTELAVEIQWPNPSVLITEAPFTVRGRATPAGVDGQLDKVQVRLNEGEWLDADGTASWSYTFNSSSDFRDGTNWVEARAIQGAATSEIARTSFGGLHW